MSLHTFINSGILDIYLMRIPVTSSPRRRRDLSVSKTGVVIAGRSPVSTGVTSEVPLFTFENSLIFCVPFPPMISMIFARF